MVSHSIQFLAIGKILRPHGVRGELLLETFTEFPEHLAEVGTVYLGPEDSPHPQPHPLRRARLHRGELLIQLGDCLDRDAADAYRGQMVFIRAEQAAPLPPGRYYHHQIIGLTVMTDEGETLGQLTEILETGANDVYVVVGPSGEILLPALQSVIQNIDLDAKTMTVHLLEGLR
jgi:16S rRNA processing protein RimM